MNVFDYNVHAWDAAVRTGNPWTVPASPAEIAAARLGEVRIVLTPTLPIPAVWLGDLAGCAVLCLASGGGQQGPILAAAGAIVTVYDASPAQLGQDRATAEREQLSLKTVQGDMARLDAFADASFDLIVHPVSNCFVPDVRPVYREAARVLRPGGALLSGFALPHLYLYDDLASERGELILRHRVPYSDLDLPEAERQHFRDRDEPLLFGHTLEDQLAGQTGAGLLVAGFYEDRDPKHPLSHYLATFAATRAIRP